MQFIWIGLYLLFFASNTEAVRRCGFPILVEHEKQVSSGSARMLLREGTCTPDDLFDSVYVDTTRHFRIFYTISGPHAVPLLSGKNIPPYIDTLAYWLEKAWDLHVNQIGMQTPKGPSQSYHYQDSRFPEKYPVEVIDIGLLRNTWNLLGGPCEACYGLTLPANSNRSLSHLIIENDFRYQTSTDKTTIWSKPNSQTCTYTISKYPVTSQSNGVSVNYAEQWATALRITAFHELYHACQLRYQDYEDQYHFWYEASATGVEDLGAPEVNDYLQYLGPIFSQPEISLLDTKQSNGMRPYGQSVFFHYLRTRFGLRFDPNIWTSLGKAPQTPLAKHFDQYFQSQGISGGFEELFHDFARKLLYAGEHTTDASSDSLWTSDLPLWPTIDAVPFRSSALPTDSLSFQVFSPTTSALAYTPEASSRLRKSIFSIGGTDYVVISNGLFSATAQPDDFVNLPAQAYPNPWRNRSPLCFTLPAGNSEIEIRDATGYRVHQMKRDTLEATTCLPTSSAAEILKAPGLYYWRGTFETTLHKLLVIR